MAEKSRFKVKVTKNGPYIVSGNPPVSRQVIISDEDGEPLEWKEGDKISSAEPCALCRCGKSRNKPFCDGAHVKAKFDGTETAGSTKFNEEAETINGPDLILKDNEKLCAGAGFCHRASGTWNLTKNSNNPQARKIAIQQACNCPSGRLVCCEKKTGKEIEPKLPQSIGIVKCSKDLSGPIWLRGGIPIESADGREYEVRNRVTLCRCGKSKNKPFCDGTHIDINFSDKD